ncbi:FecCD family ABC transporter permease [Salidesulfovibrio onnuriiensis]|uniref:FecCD family ABC transporter permease n=1 Tax=Salidesulfovibrio onnuriiensis TaxID=2583823 RepID=UPI0011CCAE11|nr:iron ABC transporter permease [Salidesulfovibrio onnuriiensis]
MYKTAPHSPARAGFWIPLLAGALFCLTVAATGMGFIPIPATDVLQVMAHKLWGADVSGLDPLFVSVVSEVRLPRILTSASVGFGLAVSGAVFQGILLNPLADPFTLGVSSGAAFGASLALLLGMSFASPPSVCLFAFAGATLTLLAVMAIAGRDAGLSPTSLILSGVIVSAILSAGISFLKYMADERVSVIIFWLMGSFASKTWGDVLFTACIGLAGFAVCLHFARDLNVMSMGDRSARSLGVHTGRVRLVLLAAASLVSAVCVSVSGIIGFVGLMVPHLMRFLTGPDNRLLIPASGLCGAILLLAADTLTRAVLPQEVPIGVLTALLGGPVFCVIFRRRHMGGGRG